MSEQSKGGGTVPRDGSGGLFDIDPIGEHETAGYDVWNLAGEVTVQTEEYVPPVVSPGYIKHLVFDTVYLADVVKGKKHELSQEVEEEEILHLRSLYGDSLDTHLNVGGNRTRLKDSIKPRDFPEMVREAHRRGITTYRLEDFRSFLDGTNTERLDWITENTEPLEPGDERDPVKGNVNGTDTLSGLTVYVTAREGPSHIIDRDKERSDLIDVSPQIMYRWLKAENTY